MVQTHPSSAPYARNLIAMLRTAAALGIQVVIGALLILVAGMAALMTAIAGVTLAGAALAMRFLATARPTPPVAVPGDSAVTLEARRTPRGWTVE
ncbi:MAG: hypothetical protein ACK46Q_08465 [Hyphomonas sp.]